jgi:acetolactate synthase-1/2/3 large subunit
MMGQIAVAELLVKCFEAEGVEMVSGIIDGAHVPLIVQLDRHGIRYINAHHEEAAVHMAEGYARITRKPGVVIGNPACGTGNMLAGVMSAHGEGHPIVAIGTTRSPIKAVPNRGGAWQAADTENMARPITKYSETVRQWQRLPEMVRAAFRAATTGRPGPAFLNIPDDLLATVIDADAAPPVYPAERYRVTNMGAGDPSQISRAAELLANAERPYLHAGKGVLWADGGEEFQALGDYLAAPMSTSLGARGVISEDHPNCFHPFDMMGAGLARNEADVVLIVGARLGEYDGWGMPPLWGDPAGQTTIHIDSDPMSIGLNRPVCLISGDGAFGFNLMELETAAREKLPIVVIVAVDGAWGMEKSAFYGQGYGPKDWEKSGIELAPVRYDKAAEAMGCHGEFVDAVDQLGPAVERAVASGKPAVIHVQVDHHLNTVPPGLEQFQKVREM